MIHSFQPKDLIEVETRHGIGYILYVTVYGPHQNDVFTIATKKNGRIRHYRSIDVRLAPNPAFDINSTHAPKEACDQVRNQGFGEESMADCNSKVTTRY